MVKRFATLSGLICVLICAPCVSAQGATDIIYMTEEYPPFNYTDDDTLRGIAVDLLDRMVAQLNSTLVRERIKVLPWVRGFHLAQNQAGTMLFSTTRTPQREQLFKWVGPIATNKVVLIARRDREIEVESTDDLKTLKLGVIRNDIGQDLLLQAGIKQQQLDAVGDAVANIKKLDRGRIDAWAYGEPVAKWFIRNNGLDPAQYETIYVLEEADLYYAFHIAAPDELIERFQAALDELKKPRGTASSEYDEILEKYIGQ